MLIVAQTNRIFFPFSYPPDKLGNINHESCLCMQTMKAAINSPFVIPTESEFYDLQSLKGDVTVDVISLWVVNGLYLIWNFQERLL